MDDSEDGRRSASAEIWRQRRRCRARLVTARTILVADDEADVRSLILALLEDEGYRVVVAANGRAAIEVVERRRPDLILMDIMMPTMDGREATRRLRARPESASIPIVLMSAVTNESPQPGVQAFVAKPFDLDDLLATIDRLLDESPAAGC
ncbi:MAG TPA: response regulator [Thermomicrobiales bacterium]|nr:response regulator [Thermomicrobiales bacterium]